MGFNQLTCPRCGGDLTKNGENYTCINCGKSFERERVASVSDELRAVLNEQKQEAVANLRRQLWAEMHEKYINSKNVVALALDIKKYLPEDYFANFADVANSGNVQKVNEFLNSTSPEQMSDYADAVLDFMLKSPREGNLTSISLFIERAFKGDTQNYDKYATLFQAEAEKVKKGIYEPTLPRDVFLAYSSADIAKVIELCDYLESQNLSCFMALRNLRHGRGAADNYEKALRIAMDNCKTVVFVSSRNSRSLECDALRKELPYIRQRDVANAPPEYANNYTQIPVEYLKPRVEYLIGDYCGDIAEIMVKEFFHGLEWCKNEQDVAARLVKYLTEDMGANARQRADRERKEAEERLAEQRRLLEEQQRSVAELEKKISSATTLNSPASASTQSLLTRASQELQMDNQEKAKEYYGRVLDIKPDCAEAWYGLFLIDFECTSDEELLAKIKKVSFGGRTLFDIEDSKNLANVKKYADSALSERVQAVVDAKNARIETLLNEINGLYNYNLNDCKNFYTEISNRYPDRAEAWFGLFLIDYGCTNVTTLKSRISRATYNDNFLFTLTKNKNYVKAKKLAKTNISVHTNDLATSVDERIDELIDGDFKAGFEVKNAETVKTFYGKILKDNPKCGRAWFNLFLLDCGYNDYDELITAVEEATYELHCAWIANMLDNENLKKAREFAEGYVLPDNINELTQALKDKAKELKSLCENNLKAKQNELKSKIAARDKIKVAYYKTNPDHLDGDEKYIFLGVGGVLGIIVAIVFTISGSSLTSLEIGLWITLIFIGAGLGFALYGLYLITVKPVWAIVYRKNENKKTLRDNLSKTVSKLEKEVETISANLEKLAEIANITVKESEEV